MRRSNHGLTLNLDVLTTFNPTWIRSDTVLLWCGCLDFERDGVGVGVVDQNGPLDQLC